MFYLNLTANQSLNPDFYERGIGSHRAEGFGKVLVNPDFLQSDTHTLPQQYAKYEPDAKPRAVAAMPGTADDATILAAIGQRYLRNLFPSQIERDVQAFIHQYEGDFKNLSNSQWGTLRNYAKNLPNYEAFYTMVFQQGNGFMYRGISEKEWIKKNRRGILEEFVKDLPDDSKVPFIVRLCNQMPKLKQRTDELSA